MSISDIFKKNTKGQQHQFGTTFNSLLICIVYHQYTMALVVVVPDTVSPITHRLERKANVVIYGETTSDLASVTRLHDYWSYPCVEIMMSNALSAVFRQQQNKQHERHATDVSTQEQPE